MWSMEERENNPKRQYAEYDYDMDMKMQGQKHYNEGIQIGEARGKIKGLISIDTRMKKLIVMLLLFKRWQDSSKDEIEKL